MMNYGAWMAIPRVNSMDVRLAAATAAIRPNSFGIQLEIYVLLYCYVIVTKILD